MEQLVPLLVQILGGAAGGNAIGALLKKLDLDKIIATIAGVLGGVGGGQLADYLGILEKIVAMIGGTAGDVAANGGASAAGGALLTVIVGLIKKAMAKP